MNVPALLSSHIRFFFSPHSELAFLFSFCSFLVACTRLYNPLCPSVGRLVGWSAGWSIEVIELKSGKMSVLDIFYKRL